MVSKWWTTKGTEDCSNMIKFIKRLICKHKGHDWDTYTVATGYWSYDIEQAGYCTRCGYDTHGEYLKH